MKVTKRRKSVRDASRTKKDRVEANLDPIHRHILETLKLRAPPEADISDAKIIRYCISEVGRTQRQKIIAKIAEHDNKADWWRQKLKDFDQVSEDLQK